MPCDRIVAVCLLTQSELDRYGDALKQVFAVEDTPCFSELLRLIDEADRQHWRAQDRQEALGKLRSQDDA
jgi:hypothetical protein